MWKFCFKYGAQVSQSDSKLVCKIVWDEISQWKPNAATWNNEYFIYQIKTKTHSLTFSWRKMKSKAS